jgi:3-(3-hydroxy-phenyl)propionate hydroxylase
MSHDTDVLIFGAGPVGLTAGNELLRHGARAMIVDKAPAIREVSKAMILHVRTQEVLDKVGIAERARREAQPLTEVVVHAYGKHIGSWDVDDFDSPYRHPLIIGQNRTQHLMLDLLHERGGSVHWNTEAVSFKMDSDGVTSTLKTIDPATKAETEKTVRSRYIVGAEGSNSLVRRSLNFTFEGERYSGEQFIQADCKIRWSLPKGRSYLFLTADGYMMVIEFPDDVVRIFISLPDQNAAGAAAAATQLGAVEATTEEPTLDEIRYHLERLTGFSCELSDATWLARYRTSHRYSNRFSHGRAFIAGDAAHVHVPIGGQGMNTGIQDAFNLAWKLAGVIKGALKETVLESYHIERHPVAQALIKGTNFAYKGILHPSEARQWATRMFGPYVIKSERAQTFMRNTLEELRVFYPNSPLNLDLGGSRGPKPGERVLHAEMVRASDRATVPLNEIIRSPAFTLFLFGGTEPAGSYAELSRFAQDIERLYAGKIDIYAIVADREPPKNLLQPDRVLLDALHMAHGAYGVERPAFYLLRPDTYVAARGPVDQAKGLLDHLGSIFR